MKAVRSPLTETELIRRDILNGERLEDEARALALAQPVRIQRSNGRFVVARLRQNYRVLLDVHRQLAQAQTAGQAAG